VALAASDSTGPCCHNGAVNTAPSTLVRRLAATLLGLALLAGCGGTGDGDGETPETEAGTSATDATSAVEETAEPEPYLDVPAQVTLTEAGAAVDLGASATVAWQPRQKEVAVLDLQVDRVERTSFDKSFQGYRIDKKTAAMTPFFVRASATNPTGTNLGGQRVPLYLADSSGTLVEESVVKGTFPACSGGVLPKKFGKGASADLCFVYFVEQGSKFDNVTFQLPGDLAAVTWSGKVSTKVQPPKQQKNKNGS
jgi:hypothetical protein